MCFRPATVTPEKKCPKCGESCSTDLATCPACGAELTGTSMPGTPGIPNAPGAPMMPKAPGVPGAPKNPKAPGVPD